MDPANKQFGAVRVDPTPSPSQSTSTPPATASAGSQTKGERASSEVSPFHSPCSFYASRMNAIQSVCDFTLQAVATTHPSVVISKGGGTPIIVGLLPSATATGRTTTATVLSTVLSVSRYIHVVLISSHTARLVL